MNDKLENDCSLDSLIGEHELDGVDRLSKRVEQWGNHFADAEVLRFRLDGIVYTAIEDPENGYRSSLDRVFISTEELSNTFPKIKVLARKKADKEDNVLEFVDAKTGKVVLSVGTGSADDYYPYFISEFYPENMATNA
jgi:hypothetical protein